MTQPASQPGTGVEEHLAIPGKVSYLEIPANDPDVSAAFYRDVFGWEITEAHPGRPSFTDAGGLIGAFVAGHQVAADGGVLPYIYVSGIDRAVTEIRANGGEMVGEPYPEGDLWVATFRDPAGNIMGIWQAGPR